MAADVSTAFGEMKLAAEMAAGRIDWKKQTHDNIGFFAYLPRKTPLRLSRDGTVWVLTQRRVYDTLQPQDLANDGVTRKITEALEGLP